MNINVYIYLHGNKTQYQVGCKTWSPLTCFVPENLHESDCSICLWAAAMDSFVLLLNSCKVKWKMKLSDKQTTSPFSRTQTQNLLSETCQKRACDSKTGPKIRVSSSAPLLLLIAVSVVSYFQSFIRPLIYSFTASPQRRQKSLLSCYSNELLKPPAMNNSAAENGGRMSVFLTPLWSFKKPFYLLLHIWWPRYNEFNEGGFARRQVLDFRLVWISKARLSESGTD